METASDDRRAVPRRRHRGSRYRIADLVALTGVPSSSIHYYLRRGVLPAPERPAANLFVYDDRHVAGLRTIRSLRGRGRPLAEIQRLLRDASRRGGDAVGAIELSVEPPWPPSPRARLVDAAITAFGNASYHDVSVRSLCRGAGVAKGTFYRYFPNKDALFIAAATAVVDRAVTGYAADVAAGIAVDPRVGFAAHLRECLPLLFELGKRSIQDTGPTARAAVQLFVDLVQRLGRISGPSDDAAAARVGGVLVIVTLVQIFTRLVEADIDAPPAG